MKMYKVTMDEDMFRSYVTGVLESVGVTFHDSEPGNGEDHEASAPKPPPKVRAKRRTKAEMEAGRAAA
jgi:hypothetical protein